MINFWHEGVTFLGGGKVRREDLLNVIKFAPNLIAADGSADIASRNNLLLMLLSVIWIPFRTIFLN